MRRKARVVVGAAASLLVLLALALAVVFTLDGNRIKPWLTARVAAALGRPFAIDGDLVLSWEWDGLRPRPYLAANDVHVGRAPNAIGENEFAVLEGADVRIDLLPLLAHRVDMPTMVLRAPVLRLERAADGRSNWQFGSATPDAASPWQLKLGRLQLDRGRVEYVDAQRKTRLHIEVTPLKEAYSLDDAERDQDAEAQRAAATHIGSPATAKVSASARQHGASPGRRTRQNYAFAFTATGTYQGAAVNASGRLGDVFDVRDPTRPFPLQAKGTIGATHLALVGTLTDPANPDALDLRLWMSGPSLDQLFPILGVVLPATPPYATDGRLVGRFGAHQLDVTYRHFSAQLGASELSGDVRYARGDGRPQLTGAVHSEHLRFADLAPLIGGKAPPLDKTAALASDRRFPTTPLHIERWATMDADVDFSAQQVERDDGDLPIGDIATHIVLKDRALLLKPLRFALARGSVSGEIAIDGTKTPAPGAIDLQMRGVQLKALLAGFESLQKTTLGEINGDLRLAGRGDSVAALLGTADGHIELLLDEGQVSKSMLEIAGLNVLNYVLTKLFGDEPVRIHCAAASLVAKQGTLRTELFVVNTEKATISVEGSVDLAHETLDLTVRPEATGVRLLTLRTPLHVRGTLSKPDVGVNKGPLVLRGIGAAALATLAPAAALGALIAPSHERENACRPLLDRMKPARR